MIGQGDTLEGSSLSSKTLEPDLDLPSLCLHVGYFKNTQVYGDIVLSGEYVWNRKYAGLLHFGGFPWSPSGRRSSAYFSYYVGIEGRFYFALRGKEACSGLFVGPSVGYNRIRYTYNSSDPVKGLVSWGHIGISFGYQQAFLKRIRAGLSIAATYPKEVLVQGFDQQDHRLYRYQFETPLVGYLRASVGYQF